MFNQSAFTTQSRPFRTGENLHPAFSGNVLGAKLGSKCTVVFFSYIFLVIPEWYWKIFFFFAAWTHSASASTSNLRCYLLEQGDALGVPPRSVVEPGQLQVEGGQVQRVGWIQLPAFKNRRGGLKYAESELIGAVFRSLPSLAPVVLGDLLAVSDGAVPVVHVETHPHGLVHHVKHVHVGVVEDGSHLVQALLAHLQ